MRVAGVIAEYNPLHRGHLRLLEAVRERLGQDAAIVCVMSGNFVQRGDFAIVRKHVRAAAAVESGADLVLELPLPWAVAPAERFADGGVQTLLATGLVTDLAFGSEVGDAAALQALADCLDSEQYRDALHRRLTGGAPFAACRQAAAMELVGEEAAALLATPNNNLGVEYLRAVKRHNGTLTPLTVRRGDGGHDGPASAFALRELLRQGERKAPLSRMPPAMAKAYREEESAGRVPVFRETCERAILARLRSMTEADFAALDSGSEGMYRRLYNASRTAASLDGLLSAAKTKRYAYARLRRMALWAYLGLTDFPERIPYLRVLAANAAGRTLLARMRKSASLPLLTKPADVRRLSPEAQRVFTMEAKATDLYVLAYPDLSAAGGGTEWTTGPVMLDTFS